MITASTGGTPQHLHQPVHANNDFPQLVPSARICQGCSYSTDGVPLTPVAWPCPKPAEEQAAAKTDALRQNSAAVRLARAVVARRAGLGLTQKQLADRAEVALRTVSAIETTCNRRPHRSTLDALDRGLRWRPGSAQRVWRGGGPDERPTAWEVPPERALILRAGLPADAEAALVDHLDARRQDAEAALEQEARLLLGQTLRLVHLGVAESVD
ncbi:helix-turn-helix transcriptional regulator [Verrucosispora sp. TAA-831]|uniref:helix-turn-helix transcriptional regulator n=1 Tax=Verrucosispora sp. TAA-831 TaxID=3422227 RepID=UPI003D6E3670